MIKITEKIGKRRNRCSECRRLVACYYHYTGRTMEFKLCSPCFGVLVTQIETIETQFKEKNGENLEDLV